MGTAFNLATFATIPATEVLTQAEPLGFCSGIVLLGDQLREPSHGHAHRRGDSLTEPSRGLCWGSWVGSAAGTASDQGSCAGSATGTGADRPPARGGRRAGPGATAQ
jgi:hypothetical protein